MNEQRTETIDHNDPEILLVASALLRPALAAEAARYVNEEDFEDSRLGKVWTVIVAMIEEGLKENDIDVVGVGKRFSTVPSVQRKVAHYCDQLMDGLPRATSLVMLAQRVKRRATMRLALGEMRKIATELKSQIESNDGEMPDLDSRLTGLSVAVTTRSDTQTRRTQYKDMVGEVCRYLDGLSSGDTSMYIPTGLPTVDRKLGGGLRPGQLHVILGGTGSGKTALASQLCDSAVAHGRRALMFSMEVDPLDVYIRDVERVAGKSRWDLRYNHKREEAQAAFMAAHTTLLDKPLSKVVYGEPISVEGIRQAVLTERLRGGKVDMIAVDHAQVAKPSKEDKQTMPRYLQVKDTAEGLRLLARQLDVAVLLTAQLNPPQKGEKPTMALVRESKDINMAAEVVMVIWHEKGEGITGDTITTDSWLILEKVRAGQEGKVHINYRGECFRFEETAEAYS
jgi:replicative DNA helicase